MQDLLVVINSIFLYSIRNPKTQLLIKSILDLKYGILSVFILLNLKVFIFNSYNDYKLLQLLIQHRLSLDFLFWLFSSFVLSYHS